MTYWLIDAPVTPYSSLDKIQKWLDYLRTFPEQDSPEVKRAIADAELMVKQNVELYKNRENKNHE